MRRVLLASLFLVSASSMTWATTPSVSGVSGTLSGNADDATANLITISGSNLGSSWFPPAVWAPMNTNINPGVLGLQGTWTAGNSTHDISTTTLCRSGAKCLTGDDSWFSTDIDVGVHFRLGYGAHVFTHHGRRVTYSSNTPNINTKYDRIWDVNAGANLETLVLNNNGGLDKIYEHTAEPHNQNKFLTTVFVPGRDTAWHTVEYYRIINSVNNASDGQLEVRVDTWTETRTGIQTDATASPADFDPCDYFLEDDPANGSRNDGEFSYMDDIYISSTFARIYLANASTLANATTTEMLIPKSGNSSSISAYFHQGTFANGASGWIIVCDDQSLENCSSGFAVTVGAATTNLHPSLGSITQTAITASWDNVGTNQLRVWDNDSDFSSPISSGNATTPDTQGSLTCGTQYYFEVKVSTEPDGGYSSTNGTTSACSAAATSKGGFQGNGKWSGNGKLQ